MPQKTLQLLDQLTELGFTDEAFCRLHHFRVKGRNVTIDRFRRYCEELTEGFQADQNNELVQRRLRLVLDAYNAGFRSSNSEVFCALADAAFAELPPV